MYVHVTVVMMWSYVCIQFFGGNSTRVEAVDIDGPGLNSEISYDKTGEDQDKFTVDKDTGIVTVAPGAHMITYIYTYLHVVPGQVCIAIHVILSLKIVA